MKRRPLQIAAVFLIVLAIAGYLFLTYANPQWSSRLYAYQARNAENGLLTPGVSYSGAWTNWDSNGAVLSTYEYKNGKRSGPYTTYANDGSVLSRGQYVEGELDGVQHINQPDGARTEVIFKNGKRDGLERTWYASGQLAVEAPFVDGLQEGAVTFYHENGMIQSSLPHYHGQVQGVQKVWRSDGTLESEETFQDNRKNGVSTYYRPDGSVDMRLTFRNDTLDGLQTWYYPDGEKMKELTLSMGEANGRWREWDESGAVVRDEEYEAGILKGQ